MDIQTNTAAENSKAGCNTHIVSY